MQVTVTKHDRQPYLGDDRRSRSRRASSATSRTRSTTTPSGTQHGQRRRPAPIPASASSSRCRSQNFGTQTATGVTGTLTRDDPYVTILDATRDLRRHRRRRHAPGAPMTSTSRSPAARPTATSIQLGLDLAVRQRQLALADRDPGRRGRVRLRRRITLYGFGHRDRSGRDGRDQRARCATTAAPPRDGVTGDAALAQHRGSRSPTPPAPIGTIAVGATGENTADRFALSAAADCFPGHLAAMRARTSTSPAARATRCDFALHGRHGRDHDDPDRARRLRLLRLRQHRHRLPPGARPTAGSRSTRTTAVRAPTSASTDYGDEPGRLAVVDLPFPFTLLRGDLHAGDDLLERLDRDGRDLPRPTTATGTSPAPARPPT